eukprot:g379.t1
MTSRGLRLAPEVNKILYVKNLPFKITSEEIYEIFGKYGAIRQIRLGDAKNTKGTAFVCYEDIYDAQSARDHLSGFNVCGRYLIVLYYSGSKQKKKDDAAAKREEIAALKKQLSQAEKREQALQ